MKALLITFFVLMLVGCSKPAPQVDVFVCDGSLQPYATAWRVEVARRFPDAIVVICHGGEFVGGEWLVKAPMFDLPCMTAQKLVEHFKDKFPGRPVVLLACNPGHLKLGMSGVYHARDSVWSAPDRANPGAETAFSELDGKAPPAENRWQSDPGVVGNVFELVED